MDGQQKQAPFEPVEPDLFSRDLAQAINKLVKNPDLRAQMGKAGRKRVEEYFDWKAIAEQTASLYQSLKN